MADYIRRDIVLKIINTVNDTGGFAGYADYRVLFDEIDTMPAADVQPVKHGRWIEVSPKHSRCSVCDTTCLIAVYPISKGANFCPNCGAKMIKDGEQNDD